jgi:hypothetical protein
MLGLASYTGDSLAFGFFVTSSSATLETRQLRWGLLSIRVLRGSCYVSSVCYQVAPYCSDQGADLGQHVRGLDTYMTDDVGKFSRLFFDLLQDLFFIF